jgi:hypothetical protein
LASIKNYKATFQSNFARHLFAACQSKVALEKIFCHTKESLQKTSLLHCAFACPRHNNTARHQQVIIVVVINTRFVVAFVVVFVVYADQSKTDMRTEPAEARLKHFKFSHL